jgi:hypothetical protein
MVRAIRSRASVLNGTAAVHLTLLVLQRNVRLVQGILIVVVIVVAVITRPVEARLWRAGKLSDRTTAILLLGRFGVVVFLFAVIGGGAPLFVLAITALATLPALAFYRFTLGLLREQKAG